MRRLLLATFLLLVATAGSAAAAPDMQSLAVMRNGKQVGNAMVPAHHYMISGGLAREDWCVADGVLSHVRFAASDGSQVDYHRQ